MGASVLRLFAPVEDRLQLRHDDLLRDAGCGVRLLDLATKIWVISFLGGNRPLTTVCRTNGLLPGRAHNWRNHAANQMLTL